MGFDIEIYLSRHGRNRMRKFGITMNDIKKALAKPILEQQSIKGRKNVWAKYRNGFIRVTYIKEKLRIVIITAVIKDKLPKEGET